MLTVRREKGGGKKRRKKGDPSAKEGSKLQTKGLDMGRKEERKSEGLFCSPGSKSGERGGNFIAGKRVPTHPMRKASKEKGKRKKNEKKE